MGVLDDAIRAHLDLKREHGAPDDEITRQSQEALGPPRRERPQADDDEVAAQTAAGAEAGEPAEAPAARDGGEKDPPADEDLFGDMPARGPGRAAGAVGDETVVQDDSPTRPSSETPFDAREPDSPPAAEAEPSRDPGPPPGPVLPEQGGNGAQGSAGPPPAAPLPESEPSTTDGPSERSGSGGDPDATMLYETVGETPPDAETETDTDTDAETAVHRQSPLSEPPAATAPRDPSTPPGPAPADSAPVEPTPAAPAGETAPADEQPRDESEPRPAGEDVLEDTPEFLQETPEDERLWFEQKPPRDFDFDD